MVVPAARALPTWGEESGVGGGRLLPPNGPAASALVHGDHPHHEQGLLHLLLLPLRQPFPFPETSSCCFLAEAFLTVLRAFLPFLGTCARQVMPTM